MASLYDQIIQKKKTTKASAKQVQQVKQHVERNYKKNYYSSGNMVKDKMSQKTHFNKNPNPAYAVKDALEKDSRRYLTGGRASWKIGYDVKDASGNKTGIYKRDKKQEKKYYEAKYIQNAGTHGMVSKAKSGKIRRNVVSTAPNQMKEYKRNLNNSWGHDKYNLSPINKVDPNGKTTGTRIKAGLTHALKTSTPIGKIGAIAGAVGGGGLNGVMEVMDGLNTLNYGAHGAISGFVEGMNNNGKLDKGELGKAFSNAGKKGKKGIRAGISKKNEGRYGFYDTLKAFSDDNKEDDIRAGKTFTQADEKKRLSKLMWSGLGLDIGGALLTANAGTLATKGAGLLAKGGSIGNKIGGTALKGLSKVARVTDLGVDLPILDLMRGSGHTLKSGKPIATTFDEIAPSVEKQLTHMGKGANTEGIFDHAVNKTVNTINKNRGVRDVKYGTKIAGYEVLSPKVTRAIADSPLNVPVRALNSVIDKIHATRRAGAYTGDTMENIMMKNIRQADKFDKLDYTTGVNKEVATDLQLLANRGTSRESFIRQAIQNQREGVPAPHTKIDEENLTKAELENTPYLSRRAEESMNNQYDTQVANDTIPNTDLTPDEVKTLEWRKQQELNKTNNTFDARNVRIDGIVPPVASVSPRIASMVEDKPALQEVISKLRRGGNRDNTVNMFENTVPHNYNEIMSKQGYDMINHIDELPEKEAQHLYAYLQKNDPKTYNMLMHESNVADDIIDRDIYRAQKRADSSYVKDELGVDKRQLLKQNKYNELFGNRNQLDKLNKAHQEKVITSPPLEQIKKNPNEISHNERRTTFQNTLKESFKPNLDKKSILQRQADIENIAKPLAQKGKLLRKDRIAVIDKLNKTVFDGKKVLSHNASKKDLNQFLDLYNRGLDNSYNDVPEILNQPMSEIKKFMESVTDDNYQIKFDKRAEEFGITKTEMERQIKEIKAKGKLTVADREQIRKLEKTKVEFGQWWDRHGKMTPDEWEKAYPTSSRELKGYSDAIEESAITAKYDKLNFDDVVTAPKGTDEYKRQMQEWEEYKLDKSNDKILEQKRNQAVNSPLSEKELLNGVGEHNLDNIARQTKAIREQFNLPKTKPNKAKIKLSNGQKPKDLPPVKENLAHLRKTIEQEVEFRYKNPNQYKSMEQSFKQIKKEYVETLRSYGIPDNGYFHKVKALQDDLDLYFKELSKPVRKGNKPLVKMDLQTLARKITDTFDEIENSAVKMSDEITPLSDVTPLSKLVRGEEPIKDKLQALIGKTPKNGSESVETPLHDLLNGYTGKTADGYVPRILEQGDNISKEITPDESQVDMLGYINGKKLDVNKKSLYKKKKAKRNGNLPTVVDNVDEGSMRFYSDKLFENGINPAIKPPEIKPNNVDDELYSYWKDFWNKVQTKDNSTNSTKELNAIDNYMKKRLTPERMDEILNKRVVDSTPDKSLENINAFEDSMKNSTKKIHDNIDEYRTNQPLQDVPDNYKTNMEQTNELATTSENTPRLSMNLRNNSPKGKTKSNPLEKLLKGYDVLTREFKAGVTTNNPGWHVMNALQNKMNSSYGIGNGIFDLKANKQGKMVVNNMKGQKKWLGMNVGKAPKTDAELSKIMVNDKYSLKDIKDIAEQEGLVDDTFMNDLGKPEGVLKNILLPSGDKSMWGGFGANKLIRTEENDKLHHLISSLKQGKNSAEAVDSVNKNLFDYNDINDFEKNVAKRVMPFYTYYRKNIPLQIQHTLESPRAMATYTDAKNQFEKGIDDEDKQRRDEWTANRLQVPNTTKQEKGRPDTMYNKMYNPSTPWDALMNPPMPTSDGISNIPSTNPILESAYRLYKGEDMFGNKYEDNNKNILDVIMEQYVQPTMGVSGKAMDLGKQSSKENDELLLLQMLTGLKTKYYKSNQEWNFEDNKDDKKSQEFKKKVLEKKYK